MGNARGFEVDMRVKKEEVGDWRYADKLHLYFWKKRRRISFKIPLKRP